MTINKLYYLFFAFILLQACNIESVDNPDTQENPEEETEEPTDNILIKRIVYNQGTSEEDTEVFNYSDGNKLMSVDYGDGDKIVFTYENDKIVMYESYGSGLLLSRYDDFDYDAEARLTNYVEYWYEPTGLDKRAYRHILTYNNDNTITEEKLIGDHNSQTEPWFTETLYFTEENITNIKDVGDNTQYIYSYDNRKGMFKNIHAIKTLNLLTETEFGPYIYGNTNNITSNIESYTNNVGEEFYEYTYNEGEYPETAISKFKYNGVIDEDQTETVHFYYE